MRGCVEIDGASQVLSAKFRKSGSRPSKALSANDGIGLQRAPRSAVEALTLMHAARVRAAINPALAAVFPLAA